TEDDPVTYRKLWASGINRRITGGEFRCICRAVRPNLPGSKYRTAIQRPASRSLYNWKGTIPPRHPRQTNGARDRHRIDGCWGVRTVPMLIDVWIPNGRICAIHPRAGVALHFIVKANLLGRLRCGGEHR